MLRPEYILEMYVWSLVNVPNTQGHWDYWLEVYHMYNVSNNLYIWLIRFSITILSMHTKYKFSLWTRRVY